ncbi:glycosyl transferase [Mycobacterium intermedium]|uniref:Glycosyl transferase n=2 Tax=Mycobacterium intermedium TaxID=28445 RepID=A0A1E3S273_MYCIE|nr:glycosyltransferase [Mycobacterium intermedium]ODQ96208.1 glycosyl transferase [Mycobacterium intermedium]OPE46533.1 glycosyl transferase [Mycobacterium intermedium]ORA94799.1 glycosyl transferase [Mycobacterium intermedium]
MIVRNEAAIIRDTLTGIAPYISAWVIVDTGSDDGTQDVIRDHMARLGIPGELYERPWRNFGHNRSEALALAQGHGDYIWVLDADDRVVGNLDFGELGKDLYQLRHGEGFDFYWRPNLFRDGLPVRYEGVVHEYVMVDSDYSYDRLDGDYYIDSRRLGARNRNLQQKFESDRDLLLAELERNPEDPRSVFYLAQSYFDLGDFENARKWYQRRVDMGGWAEEVYQSMYRVAESMWKIGAPWPEVQDAYLRAWEFRPTRAEPLYAIAFRYRLDERYRLGYLFAKHAAEIPIPTEDTLVVSVDTYTWGALDEAAVCASWIGKHAEAIALWRRILAKDNIPIEDRQRITENCDNSATQIFETVAAYPGELARDLTGGRRVAEVVLSVVAGPNREATEVTLNSLLNCCTDVSRIGRYLVIDAGLPADDRAILLERYPFLEFLPIAAGTSTGAMLSQIRDQIYGRFWLHLGQGWQFYAQEQLITRLTSVLEAEENVYQVAVNFTDADKLIGATATDDMVSRAPDAGRYVLGSQVAYGPAMFETTRLDRVGGIRANEGDPLAELGPRATAAGLATASLDEVLCINTLPARLSVDA